MEGLSEAEASRGERFSIDRMISAIVTDHPERMTKIQSHIDEMGLRALTRNNCRAKNSVEETGPDIFGKYPVSKRVPVPYRDDKGRLRWDKKRRSELSFADIDKIIARWRSHS